MKRFSVLVLLASLVLPFPAMAADDVAKLVEMMARVGYANSPSFSPDGSSIAFLSNLSGLPQVWVVPAKGGYPRQVTASDDPVTGMAWSPTGEWIAISIAPGGGLNSQVWIVRPDGTGLKMLTEGGTVNNWLGGWTPDGSAIAVASSRRTPEAMDAYLHDLAGGHKLVAKNKGIGYLIDATRDGASGLLYRMVSRGSNDLYAVDVATGREQLLTPHEGPGEAEGVISPDGRTVYLATNLITDRFLLGRVKLTPKGPGPIEILLAHDNAELEGVVRDFEGKSLALMWNAGGRTELGLYDIVAKRERRLTDLPFELGYNATFSRDGLWLAVTGGGSAATTDIWLLDVTAGTWSRVTSSSHPGVKLDELVKPELVKYEAHDGVALSGWLYRAKQAKGPGAVVVNFHGGPEGQARPSFNSTFQALLANGISIFDANVRGSSGFGKTFVNLDNGALRVGAVKDIKATVDALVASGVADPRSVGIMGGSYGGYMVMAGLAEYPQMFGAGANLFGVVNFETFFKHTEGWMAAISTIEYGDPVTEAAMLRELSPIHKVDRVVAPTIVLHGANDTNVPVVEAEQVVDSLKKRNVPVKYVLFPDEGHGWRKTKNRITSAVEIVNWFVTHLAAGK
ncbi:MAG: S9 family peptidase [Thermoanaerobaculia bacterium]